MFGDSHHSHHSHGLRNLTEAQLIEHLDERLVVVLSLGLGLGDVRQHRANGIHHRQQAGGDGTVEPQFSIAQPDQQAFADMGDVFQDGKAQKAARPLDRVNRAKDARQPFAVVGSILEGQEITIELVEVLVTFDEKFLDDFFKFIHSVANLSPDFP